MRLDIRRTGAGIKDKDNNVVGNHVKVKVAKNKVAPPFRIAEFDIMYGHGISKSGEIVDLGVDQDIIQKSGAWYAYDNAKIAQGREAAKQFLLDNPEVADEIEEKIKIKIMGLDIDDSDDKAKKNGKAVKAEAEADSE
jgi:recombination protein RecA